METIDGLESALNANFACMCITVPEDKKKLVDKELKVLFERLNLVSQFKEKVDKVEEFVAAKVEIIKADTAKELELLPQGENVPRDAQDFKDELERITKYVTDLQKKVQEECDKYSEDVKFVTDLQ